MFKIRRVYDALLPVDREVLSQVQQILRTRFARIPPEEIEQVGEKLRNPFKQRFRTFLLVAENMRHKVSGFAMLLHDPEIRFCYLDWIALAQESTGGGIGGALYQRVRHEAADLDASGLFFECLPDDPQLCPIETLLRQNRQRLRFYEQYGARPIIDTAYEKPIQPEDICMPHLVYDGLDRVQPLRQAFARKVVRAILERKYADKCPPQYVEEVVASFRDDPVHLRPLRYVKPVALRTALPKGAVEPALVIVNEKHTIHHVHERGYVESPVRVRSILGPLKSSGLISTRQPKPFSEKHIASVHNSELFHYLRRACAQMPEGKSLYPYVFPLRNKARRPKEPSVLAGYYCIDTFTPINRNAFPAARGAVDCALTAASEILAGRRLAYALVRPPGHHAERSTFGGFCYLNNTAIAANYLSAHGRVAILDVDYHHGNGQQDIFYRRADVLTVSIHGHPRFAYPYFSGFEDEQGEGEGVGFNWNLPLPERVDGPAYRRALGKALERIRAFDPRFLIVALGLDTAKGDPTGTWQLLARDFEENGRMIGQMYLPTLVVQEGGYRTRSLGASAVHFFKGLVEASAHAIPFPNSGQCSVDDLAWRYVPHEEDPQRIRRLVAATGFFNPAEIGIAEELVQERLVRGESSGYYFVIGERQDRLAGYTCYGPIAGSANSFDLYWIAVDPQLQRCGLGRRLMQETERLIYAGGGRRIYIETSQRPGYASTRIFYEKCGYTLEASLKDFYGPGDSKAIYCKAL